MLVYLIIYLPQYGLMDIFIMPRVKIHYYLILLLKSFQLWFIDSSFNWLLFHFDIFPSCGNFIFWHQGRVLSYSLILHDALDSSFYFLPLSKVMGQGSLACCSPWDCKELDMTEQLNWSPRISHFYKDIWVILLEKW